MNLPTWITVSRLAGVPFLLILLENPSDQQRLWAIAIFLVVALTDWLDGYLQEKLGYSAEKIVAFRANVADMHPALRSRRALATTKRLESDMAPAASMGVRRSPKAG